ncbi:hypothetical protein ACFWVC_33460 [Streptomyces sp. NPDC058691]|uniref:hypothetical protein n=1 Tax=Streptomyces sp. NPDC058691 TaxID=3346601 RepID=UPI0036541466
MHTVAVTLTVLLLLEVVPSVVAQPARARPGLERLDELTRLGVLQGRHPRCRSCSARCTRSAPRP